MMFSKSSQKNFKTQRNAPLSAKDVNVAMAPNSKKIKFDKHFQDYVKYLQILKFNSLRPVHFKSLVTLFVLSFDLKTGERLD